MLFGASYDLTQPTQSSETFEPMQWFSGHDEGWTGTDKVSRKHYKWRYFTKANKRQTMTVTIEPTYQVHTLTTQKSFLWSGGPM